MKLEYTDGCTAYSLTADGVEIANMSDKEVKEIIKALIDHTNDAGTLQMIAEELLETQGDYEDLGQCEECGDWITKYTLEI
jgi:RNA polymerase-binding transcription factor DksA